MGSTAAASAANMGHGLNAAGMPGLGACAMPDSKPMQFPLAQRRKRRVLFTQAQVSRPRPFKYCNACVSRLNALTYINR